MIICIMRRNGRSVYLETLSHDFKLDIQFLIKPIVHKCEEEEREMLNLKIWRDKKYLPSA